MAKTFSGRQVANILVREFGFREAGQKGSHIKLRKKTHGGYVITVVPLHRELAMGTMRGILKLAHVEYDEFIKKAG